MRMVIACHEMRADQPCQTYGQTRPVKKLLPQVRYVSLSWPEAQRRTHIEKHPNGIGERDVYQMLLQLQATPTGDHAPLATAFTVVKILLAANSAALATKTKQCSSLDGCLRALQWEHSRSQVQPPVTMAYLFW